MTSQDKKYALIEEHFPDAIMNPEDKWRDEPWTRYDLHGILGFCGCGCPVETAKWLLDLLQMMDSTTSCESGEAFADRMNRLRSKWREAIPSEDQYPDSPAYYLLSYWIDDRGWAEHGSNVSGQWLTDKGRAAVVALEFFIEGEEHDD